MSIEAEIDVCITKCGKGYREWYVGVAANPDERLFQGHNVSHYFDYFRPCGSLHKRMAYRSATMKLRHYPGSIPRTIICAAVY